MFTDKTCAAEGAIFTSMKCVILLDITIACCALKTLLCGNAVTSQYCVVIQ